MKLQYALIISTRRIDQIIPGKNREYCEWITETTVILVYIPDFHEPFL
jgi:hypothetical protein